MRLKFLGLVVIGVSLLGLSATKLVVAEEGKAKDSGYVKVEMKGKLRAYRMLLFGETAAAITVGDTDIWLDYSKNEEVKKKGIVSFDGKTVAVKGNLEFREFALKLEAHRGGDGPIPFALRGQPVIVVESLHEVTSGDEKSAPITHFSLKVKLSDDQPISAKGGIVPLDLQFFNNTATADQTFRNEEYRFEILNKDGMQIKAALTPRTIEREIVLKKDFKSTSDQPEVSLVAGKLKASEEYYLVVSVRNLIGLSKFKAAE